MPRLFFQGVKPIRKLLTLHDNDISLPLSDDLYQGLSAEGAEHALYSASLFEPSPFAAMRCCSAKASRELGMFRNKADKKEDE